MNRISALARAILIGACLLSQITWAQSEPMEKTLTRIERHSNSGHLLTGSLSKNLMKSVTVQEPYFVQIPYQATEEYTVDIPYQVTENYTVDIPYQTTETYTDYETRYRNEYRCHDVTRYRHECRNVTRYRQQCHNEVQCHQVPGRPNCRDVQECGTNAHGQPICKTRRVCEGGSSEQRCENRRVCRDEPYTDRVCENVPYTDRECRNEQVSYEVPVTRTRTVTKYRQETRTRTVTKYRQETRTRTVTKYRDEQRCCKPVNKLVFDRQLQFHVEVVFPNEAVLAPGQLETMNIALISADAKTATVELQDVKSVHRYIIVKQQTIGSLIRVEIGLAPKDMLGESDLAQLQDPTLLILNVQPLKYTEGTLSIQDKLPAFRDVSSTYTVTLALVKQDGTLLPSEARTWTQAELKQLGGTIKLADVYRDQTKALNTLSPMAKIQYWVTAQRGGTSPLLKGKDLKVARSGTMIIQ